MIDDDTLIAYLDGQLDADAAARVDAMLERDPQLVERLERQLRLQSRISAAFDAVLTAPVPPAIVAAARPAAEVVDIASARARGRGTAVQGWWARAGAIAAALVAGLVGGFTLGGGPLTALAIRDDGTVAAGPLDRALETQLASADPGGDVRVQLSFRDADGRICRTFAWGRSDGLACKEARGWAIEGLFGHKGDGQAGDYRMAAGANPALMALAQTMMRGDPFSAAQETAARATGWQRSRGD